MRVPDAILECVGFLCLKREGKYDVIGNAFFVTVLSDDKTREFYYLITAKHLVEMCSEGDDLWVRLNTKAGGIDHLRLKGTWVYPKDTEEYDMDVAAIEFIPPRDDLEFGSIPEISILRQHYKPEDVPAELAWASPGIGDDLLAVGLFSGHEGGKNRMRPIVRFGHLAAMPYEPIKSKKSKKLYFAYLAELRSIGGLSGSPVFLIVDTDGQAAIRRKPPTFFLIGLIRGQWSYDIDSSILNYSEQELPETSSGISTVTPSPLILGLILGEKMKGNREEEMEKQA